MARRRSRDRGGLPLLVVLLAAAFLYLTYTRTGPPSPANETGCDESLWNHVYNPARLQDPDPAKHHQCLSLVGTVAAKRTEPDGDLHIRLTLDPADRHLLNQGNIADQHGDLVIEPVCVGAVSQEDAVASCAAAHSHVTIPAVGDRVRVIGVYVLDTQHGWMELHPVTSLAVL